MAYGWRGPLITISLGRDATEATLRDDWELTHEMVHLALPSLPDPHHWLEEGLATYVEPIARARALILTPEQAWADLVNGLPKGQPEAGDRGLDRTPTWGRTYWGGALFCLLADVAIRQRTDNRMGLEHALRSILAAGGSIDRDWTIDQVIEVADQAVGVSVLHELYDEMGSKPVKVDLGSLWRQATGKNRSFRRHRTAGQPPQSNHGKPMSWAIRSLQDPSLAFAYTWKKYPDL